MRNLFELIAKLHRRNKQSKFQRQGMTLIEIMIVVTLMVAIMGLIGWNILGQADKANDGLAQTQLRSLKGNIEAYRLYYRKMPERFEDLINTPDNRKIIEEVPEDPWGNAYVFEKTGNKIKIFSVGSDGLANTEDDIVVNVN
ncbi:MAG: type II secretion system protein GspG [Bradymonadales bacterium]|jgi:general secretion pathway protein G